MSFQLLLTTAVDFINFYVIPFIIAITFVAFLWNVYLYFIAKANEPEGRERARRFALWSIIAFLLMILFWGLIYFLVSGLGLSSNCAGRSDYVQSQFAPCFSPIPTPRSGTERTEDGGEGFFGNGSSAEDGVGFQEEGSFNPFPRDER